MPAGIPKKLFMFHNPKAAGTSLLSAIRAMFPPTEAEPHLPHTIREHEARQGRYEDVRGSDVYFGHYSREAFEGVRDGHAYITNFRHPVARVLSLYNYFRLVAPSSGANTDNNDVDFFCVRATKSMSFDEFIRDGHPYILTYISDHHFRQLAKSQWVYEEPTETVESVCEFIDSALSYFVCEYPLISTRWMQDTLGIPDIGLSNTTHTLTESVPLSAVSRETYRLIMDMNQRDMAIYQHAVNRLLDFDRSACAGIAGN